MTVSTPATVATLLRCFPKQEIKDIKNEKI